VPRHFPAWVPCAAQSKGICNYVLGLALQLSMFCDTCEQVLGYTMAFVFDYGLVGLWCGILTGVVVTGLCWYACPWSTQSSAV
jgi:hypothetical protein